MERNKPRRRPPPPLTPERLERAALSYLERYSNSAAGLARVLERRLRKAALDGRDAAGPDDVRAIVAKLQRLGLLDDTLFAEGRARRLARQGRSGRVIARSLAQTGLGEADIERGLATVGTDPADELARAIAFARRRRLGPFRASGEREARRNRDMAALARQGFALDLVRKVIEAEGPATLEALLAEATER